MVVDKNQAMVNYIKNCDTIKNNKLFFNFINAGDNNKVFNTIAQEKIAENRYLDGSVDKEYRFTIIDFRTMNDNPVISGHSHENIEELLDVQGIIDWIDKQEELKNYPDFGADCAIQKISTTAGTPMLNGLDQLISPNLAKYSITIIVEYIDKSKVLWNRQGGSL